MIRVDPQNPSREWRIPLPTKSRSLQALSDDLLVLASDSGYAEIDAVSGKIIRQNDVFETGVISTERLSNGNTFVGGTNLGAKGVSFIELDKANQQVRSVAFPGDYVRRSSLTPADTILYTCDNRVFEGDWSGKILREFAIAGFRHAWKAVRTNRNTTLISAGYGAFVVECDGQGRELLRWDCKDHAADVRPNFFGDFQMLQNGGLLVCNWLGHGTNLGGTGYPLLEFAPDGTLKGAWQDAERTSSLQAFALLS